MVSSLALTMFMPSDLVRLSRLAAGSQATTGCFALSHQHQHQQCTWSKWSLWVGPRKMGFTCGK